MLFIIITKFNLLIKVIKHFKDQNVTKLLYKDK